MHPLCEALPLPYVSLLFFLSMGWYYGTEIFGLMGCQSLHPGLALPTFFNNNNKHIASFCIQLFFPSEIIFTNDECVFIF